MPKPAKLCLFYPFASLIPRLSPLRASLGMRLPFIQLRSYPQCTLDQITGCFQSWMTLIRLKIQHKYKYTVIYKYWYQYSVQCSMLFFWNNVYTGHSNTWQRDACLGCIHWAWLDCEEHGDFSEGCRRAAEPGNQGQTLGTTHAGNTGQQCNNFVSAYSSVENVLIESHKVECVEVIRYVILGC